MGDQEISRRKFLGGALAAGAALSSQGCGRSLLHPFTIVPRHVLGGPGFVPPSEKLHIACVGIDGMGEYDVMGVSSENVVALCDVESVRAEKSRARHPKAQFFKDYRVMLEQVKGIDAVTVSTPDHTHAAVALAAIQMGKHVRVQKPMAHSIYEVRKLVQAARAHKVVTQMGNQGHTANETRLICEWIWGGAIGPVREVWIWTNRPVWPQALVRPTQASPIPASLDWDLWLGPAPARPYHETIYSPGTWRAWFDFGTGALGDHGCHVMDASYWALGLGLPESVEVEATSGVTAESYPTWSILVFRFPARGDRPPVTLRWYDGNKRPPCPPELKEEGRDLVGVGDMGGQLIIGDKGKIMAEPYGGGPRLIPEKRMHEFINNQPPKVLPRSAGPYEEWIAACKGVTTPYMSDFEYASGLTQTLLLGNIALRVGGKIYCDPKTGQVLNCPAAEPLIHPQFRPGWGL